MANRNISLPEEMNAFVESRMARDGHASADEFVLALIRQEQRREARLELREKLLEGLEGPAVVLDGREWDAIEREALESLEA